jgi:hypothetical protein
VNEHGHDLSGSASQNDAIRGDIFLFCNEGDQFMILSMGIAMGLGRGGYYRFNRPGREAIRALIAFQDNEVLAFPG